MKTARSRKRTVDRPRDGRREARERLEKQLRGAERSLARGRIDPRGSQRLETAAANESDLAVLNRIGDLLARSGRLEPGIELFERIGRAYAEDGFWAKAIAIYQKILRYDPRRAGIRTRLAFLYQRSGLPTRPGSIGSSTPPLSPLARRR